MVREIARAAGAHVRFIYRRITVDEARRRLLRNRESHDRHDVRDDNFELALAMFDPPDHEPDVVDSVERSTGFHPLRSQAARRSSTRHDQAR